MNKLSQKPDLRFNELYDSIIGEKGAFENYNAFLELISNCKTKSGLRYEYLSNGNYSGFYAFKVLKDIDKKLLETFISYAYSLDIPTCQTFCVLEEKFNRMLKQGKVVQFRLDSLTEFFNESNPPSLTAHKLDCINLDETRLNFYYYILVSELLENGTIEPFLKKSSKHLIFDTTDKHLDDLTIASNLLSPRKNQLGASENGIFLSLVDKNPVKFGFDPNLFSEEPYTPVPRIISYFEPEPIKSVESIIPEIKGKIKERYGASGTDFLTLSDFMIKNSDIADSKHSDLSYATRFLFMTRSAAKDYWSKLRGEPKYKYSDHYLFSPQNGYYNGVNEGWIDAAVKLAIRFNELGEEFDLARVIRLIRATEHSALLYNNHINFSNEYFAEDTFEKYQSALLKAYGTDADKFIENISTAEFC